ncbi:MAG: hypothetical protein FJY73_03280 [Candidatus Eisenbacteria bacterium]|nr:hypothetical protein [Candidatus Eisenbacteria bacterium]
MLHWLLALLITFGAAYFQRKTGPTVPLAEDAAVGRGLLRVVLHRSHGGEGDQPVVIENAGPEVTGRILWRRYPTREEFRSIELARNGERLEGALPHQPPAGKIEYRVELTDGSRTVRVPERGTAVTRFKGAVPAWALAPHVLFMFAAMLFSNAAGIAALRKETRLAALSWWTAVLLFLGGLLFGPIVQKYAFGSFWTGFPVGYDLTDNKTLIAFIAWILALRSLRKGRHARRFVLAAALVMFAIFLVPHSLLGSELKPE